MVLQDPQYVVFYNDLLSGAISGIFGKSVVHPLDLVKVRMQLYPGRVSSEAMARKILRYEGFPALYNGLTATLLRHITLTTTRLAVFNGIYHKYLQTYGVQPSLPELLKFGLYGSLVGAFVGNPSEVALVRMMANSRQDPSSIRECRKLYKGVFHALYKIASTEGFFALWRGTYLTMTRSSVIGVVQILTYSEERLVLEGNLWVRKGKKFKLKDFLEHTFWAFVSSFFTAIITLPVDNLKTKYGSYQIRSDDLTQKEIFLQSIQKSGVLHMWQGFFPYFLRLALHTTFSCIMVDQVEIWFRIIGILQPKQ